VPVGHTCRCGSDFLPTQGRKLRIKKMKTFKIFVFTEIVFLSLVTYGLCQESSEVFRIFFSSDKASYQSQDEIEFTLAFHNITRDDRYIYIDNFYYALLFTVTDEAENKQSIEMTIKYDIMWDKNNFKLVKAGEVYDYKIRAKIRKEKNPVIDFKDSLFRLTHPGTFKIYATFQGWDGMTTDTNGKQVPISQYLGLENVFLGQSISNTILIEIK
jgi:hypothetical protein